MLSPLTLALLLGCAAAVCWHPPWHVERTKWGHMPNTTSVVATPLPPFPGWVETSPHWGPTSSGAEVALLLPRPLSAPPSCCLWLCSCCLGAATVGGSAGLLPPSWSIDWLRPLPQLPALLRAYTRRTPSRKMSSGNRCWSGGCAVFRSSSALAYSGFWGIGFSSVLVACESLGDAWCPVGWWLDTTFNVQRHPGGLPTNRARFYAFFAKNSGFLESAFAFFVTEDVWAVRWVPSLGGPWCARCSSTAFGLEAWIPPQPLVQLCSSGWSASSSCLPP
jgi:hypothetical protein